MHRDISDINRVPHTAGHTHTDGYVSVFCTRCGSTSQLPAKNVMSDIILCPVCREGEIEREIRHSGTIKNRSRGKRLNSLVPYILASIRPSPN